MIFPILFIFFSGARAFNYTSINLPYEHLQYYFTNFPELYEQCKDDPECPFKENSVPNRCWGYEYNCNPNNQYSTPTCPGEFNGWVKTKQEQLKMFYNQADFGYIKQQLQEMKVICEPLFPHDSSLECSDHLRFCRGRNIWMNFTSLWKRGEPVRYTMDILGENDIGKLLRLYLYIHIDERYFRWILQHSFSTAKRPVRSRQPLTKLGTGNTIFQATTS